jgi:hypothetical protein
VGNPSFPARVAELADLCVERGVEEIILEGVQPELKGLYFRSPRLEEMGWQPLTDVLELVGAAAAQRSLRVGLNLTDLGLHARGLHDNRVELESVRPLAIADLEAVCSDLAARYRLHTLAEEEFPVEWFRPLDQLGRRLGFRYVHRCNTDDIVSLAAASPRTTPLQAYGGTQVLCTKDYFPMVFAGTENGAANGSLPLLLANHRKMVETTLWFSGPLFMENAALSRALAFAPEEVCLWLTPEGLRSLPGSFFSRVREMRSLQEPSLPVFNLVVLGKPVQRMDPGHVGWLQLAANLEAITMAAQAAGFRPVMTDRPSSEAQAFYLYLAGAEFAEWEVVESFLTSLTSKPVFVQFGARPDGTVLDAVMRFVGVRQYVWQDTLLPAFGMCRGQRVSFKGADLYEGKVPTGYCRFQAESGSVLMVDLSGQALIGRHPKIPARHLVNGSLLHRDMAFPLSRLLTNGKAFQKPAACLISMGKKTAFWALHDTEVDWINPRTGAGVLLEMKEQGFYVR